MEESAKMDKILAQLDEIKSCLDGQEQKINDIIKRIEKLEKIRTVTTSSCAGGCYSEDLALLEITDSFKPQPGEQYLKDGKERAEYKKSLWKKITK